MTEKIEFDVIVPRQNDVVPVFTFAARASAVRRFARIERAGRDSGGVLSGFQRPQIAAHIREIRDYLEKPSAILPNPIVVAFTGSATLEPAGGVGDGIQRLTIDLSDGAPGLIVDGQQRFTALNEIGDSDFELLVSGFICDGLEELQRQFILINNTRPLPKALIYELLPQVRDLPLRMSNRSQAALLTEALNHRSDSSLRGLVRQQTNPRGIIRDTVLQRLIMGSLTEGALRLHASDDRVLMENGTRLISEFFHAVQTVFERDWKGRTPKDSRLVHGTGIIAMGYVMEALHVMTGATDRQQFADGLKLLRGKTAWTEGEWTFNGERRRWNGLQNVPSDIRQLSLHLVLLLKRGLAEREQAA